MPEPTQASVSSTAPSGPSARTRVGGKWLAKTLIFMLVLLGFGCWGLWDATVVYPNRGIAYAENAQWQYLKAAKGAGAIYNAGVADPVAAYARLSDPATLKANRSAAADPTNPGQARALMEERLYEWLDGLDTIGRLKPDYTRMAPPPPEQLSPERELDRLETAWSKRVQPKPLAKYDLPVQWLFVVIGLGGGLALAGLVVKVKTRTYGWEPVEQRLFLPDGSSLVPGDIAEFDKRKWDKFLIFLKVKPGHQPHGGREVRLDLLRYIPLEDWVLAMERTAYPEHAPPPPDAAPLPSAEPPASE